MKEWRAARVRCATMTLTIFGDVYTIKTTPPLPVVTLPVQDNVVLNRQLRSTAKAHVPSYEYIVVQRHGSVLSIVQGKGTVADQARTIRNTTRIARNTGVRQLKP